MLFDWCKTKSDVIGIKTNYSLNMYKVYHPCVEYKLLTAFGTKQPLKLIHDLNIFTYYENYNDYVNKNIRMTIKYFPILIKHRCIHLRNVST